MGIFFFTARVKSSGLLFLGLGFFSPPLAFRNIIFAEFSVSWFFRAIL